MDDQSNDESYLECERHLINNNKIHWKVAITKYSNFANFNKIYMYIIKKIICNLCYDVPVSIYGIHKHDWVLLSVTNVIDNSYIYALVINIIPNDFDYLQYKVICQCIHTGKIIEIMYNSIYMLLSSIKETEIIKILNLNLELVNKCLTIQKKKDMYDITNRIIKTKTNHYICWE